LPQERQLEQHSHLQENPIPEWLQCLLSQAPVTRPRTCRENNRPTIDSAEMLQFLLLSVDALLNESPIRSKTLAPALANDKAEGSEQNRQRVGGEGQKSQIRIEKL